MVFNTLRGLIELGTLQDLIISMLIKGIIIFLIVWIYTSFAWISIAKKLKHKKPWLSFIPFARGAMILQLGSFNWAWIFLWLIPGPGWIAIIILNLISRWRIFQKRNYPGGLSLIKLGSLIPVIGWAFEIASLAILGLVAWKEVK